MSGYILCQREQARSPYFIEAIHTNIYSIEELCYYLYHNLELADETLFNEGLCTWIQEELGMGELAARLRTRLGKGQALEEKIYPVFKSINYLSYDELKKLNVHLKKLEQETWEMRCKMRGDCFMENRMYGNAIHAYQKVLEKMEEKEEPKDAGKRGRVWNNLGCAYSYLLQKEKAAECFGKAYECLKDKKSLQTYLCALYWILPREEFEKRQQELRAEEELGKEVLEKMKAIAGQPAQKVEIGEINGLLEEMIREYHRNTGF